MLKGAIKSVVHLAVGSSTIAAMKAAAIGKAEILTILNLHRVSESDDSTWRPLAPKFFDELLKFARKYFEIHTFSTLPEASRRRPLMILSFDDGYKDFIEVAAPILEKHRVAVNHNVIPGCVESGRPPLNVTAQDFVGQAPIELVRGLDIPGFDRANLTGPREAVGRRLSVFIKERSMDQQKTIADVLLPQILNWDEFRPTPMMTLPEIKQLSHTHEIGAHSYDHASMTFETDSYVEADAIKCHDYFVRAELPTKIYAFPNGAAGPDQIRAVQKAGFQTILLVDDDFSIRSNKIHKRFTFDAKWTPEVRFRAVGGLRNPFSRRLSEAKTLN